MTRKITISIAIAAIVISLIGAYNYLVLIIPSQQPVHVGYAKRMENSSYVMLNISHGGGCGPHYYDFKVIESDREKKYLKTELVHTTDDFCEAMLVTNIYLQMPYAIGFWPKKWDIVSEDGETVQVQNLD